MDVAPTRQSREGSTGNLIEGVGLTYGDEVGGDPCGRPGFGMEMPFIGAD